MRRLFQNGGRTDATACDRSLGPLGHVDPNNGGKVIRAEWLAAATARFAQIDRNGDGVLIVGEVPPPHAGRGPGGRHHHHDGRDDEGADARPAVAPLQERTPVVAGNGAS